MLRVKLYAEKAALLRAGKIMGHAGFCIMMLSIAMGLLAGVPGEARPPLDDVGSLAFATLRLLVAVIGVVLLVGASRRLEDPGAAWIGISIQAIVTLLLAADPWYCPPALAWGLVAALATLTYRVWLIVPTSFGRGQCTKCGYDLTGITSGRCPECGAAMSVPRGMAAVPRPEIPPDKVR